MKIKASFTPIILTTAFRTTAFGFLGLFSPIYIFQIIIDMTGGTLKIAILGVLLYMLVFYLMKFITFPLAENLSYKLGFKNVVALSVFPLFVFITCLILAESNLAFLILAAIFGGMQAALFWFGYHGLFIKCVSEHCFGFREGIRNSVGILTLVMTPILGSILVLALGFKSLFLVAALFSLLSALVVLFSPSVKPYRDVKFLNVFKLFRNNLRPFGAYVGWGCDFTIFGSVWPIFLILILGDILSYGGVISAGILLSFLITLLIGRWVDKAKSKEVISWGVVLGAVSWLFRMVVRLPLFIVGVDAFYRISEQMLAIPMDVASYKKALRGWVSDALYFREISLNIGSILALVGAIVLIWLGLPLWSAFGIGFLGTLAPILVIKEFK